MTGWQKMLASDITNVASRHAIQLRALPGAAEHTNKIRQKFTTVLTRELDGNIPPDLDVVLLGSFGRSEVTAESDCDYLLLLRATPPPEDIKRVFQAVESTRESLELGEAGRTGTFGDFVTATELFARIGLESDSNANTTRRLLLLSESVSALDANVTNGIKQAILRRYLGDYAPEMQREKAVHVPHFLLNDLTRYWRTIAVDFGAKQWRALSRDWYLRYAKLLTTRKVLFAGTLAVLLDTANALDHFYAEGPVDQAAVFEALNEHLRLGLQRSPLARLMELHDRLEAEGGIALANLLRAYDRFIEMLDDSPTRAALKGAGTAGIEARQEVEELGRVIHDSLLVVFNDDPLLRSAMRQYAVF